MLSRMQWRDWATVVLGLWLIASPWIVGFADHTAAMWNALLLGLAIAAVEFIDVYFPDPWSERVNLLLGLWVAISPMLLGFAGVAAAMWSTTLTGTLVVVLSAWTGWQEWHKPPAASH